MVLLLPFLCFPQRENHFLQRGENHPFLWQTDFVLRGQGTGSLLSYAGHGLLGGVLQVDGRSDGEPAAAEDALGLVDVGSWEGQGHSHCYGTGGCPRGKPNMTRRPVSPAQPNYDSLSAFYDADLATEINPNDKFIFLAFHLTVWH